MLRIQLDLVLLNMQSPFDRIRCCIYQILSRCSVPSVSCLLSILRALLVPAKTAKDPELLISCAKALGETHHSLIAFDVSSICKLVLAQGNCCLGDLRVRILVCVLSNAAVKDNSVALRCSVQVQEQMDFLHELCSSNFPFSRKKTCSSVESADFDISERNPLVDIVGWIGSDKNVERIQKGDGIQLTKVSSLDNNMGI